MRLIASFTLTALVSCNSIIGQNIINVIPRLDGEKIIISYNLQGDQNELFRIEIYSSHNNYSSPLKEVSGDMGDDIAPGTNKTILWDAKSVLGNFRGDLDFEIRGFIMPPFLEFTNPSVGGSLKRGKTNQVSWKLNQTGSQLKFELHQNGSLHTDLGNIQNTGTWSWFVPKKTKPGKNFQIIAISGPKQVSSTSFRISPKIPLVVKILPLAVIGGLVAVIVSGGSDEPTVDKIPYPKRPDGN